MNCPKCQQTLRNRTVKSVAIHECGNCHGTWFERDALRKLKDRTDADLNWMDFELWKHPERIRVSAVRVQCPRCNLEMVAIDYDETGVEVEFCKKCLGVWLGAGKFERIVEALTQELATKDISEYIEESLDEAKQIILGPEDPISEWRDFLTVVRMLNYRILTDNPKLQKALLRFQEGLPK